MNPSAYWLRIARLVYDFLLANRAQVIPAADVAASLGLSYSQVVYAVHVLRNARAHFAMPVPLCTLMGRGGGYIVSNADDRTVPYRRGEMRYIQTRVQTFRSNMAEHLETQIASGTPSEQQAARLLLLQVDRFIQDVGLLVPNGTP